MTNQLRVAPGDEVRAQLRVRNMGTVVDRVRIEMLGDARSFASAEPPEISLFPGAEQTVALVFQPAKTSSAVAGMTPFAVRVLSSEDPQGSSVEEGVVEVLSFDERTADLRPRKSKGKRSAVHYLAVDNHGNAPIHVRFSGLDPEDQLDFKFSPPGAVTAPGTAQIVKVRVKPTDSFWGGSPRTYPFTITVDEDGQPPTAIDGTMVQEAKAPKWFWRTALAAIALAALAAILWPNIKQRFKTGPAPVVSIPFVLNTAVAPVTPSGNGPAPTAQAGLPPVGPITQPRTPPPATTARTGSTKTPSTKAPSTKAPSANSSPPTKAPAGTVTTYPPGSNEGIVVAVNPWTGSAATANVAKVVLEKYLGTDTTLTTIDANGSWVGLDSGSIDALLEVWPSSHVTDYDTYVTKNKTVVDIGKLGPVGKIGWYVPSFVIDEHPELATIDGFKDPAEAKLFAGPAGGDRGQFWSGDENHVNYDQAIISNFGLPFDYTVSGSEAGEVATIQQAVTSHTPMLFQFSQPQWLQSRVQLTEVKLPPVTKECQAAAVAPDHSAYNCDYAPEDLYKVANANLPDKNRVAFTFLSKFQLTTDQQNQIAAYIGGDNMDPAAAAQKWVSENPDVITAWLTA